jgi:hypothetical protein
MDAFPTDTAHVGLLGTDGTIVANVFVAAVNAMIGIFGMELVFIWPFLPLFEAIVFLFKLVSIHHNSGDLIAQI